MGEGKSSLILRLPFTNCISTVLMFEKPIHFSNHLPTILFSTNKALFVFIAIYGTRLLLTFLTLGYHVCIFPSYFSVNTYLGLCYI